MARPETPQLAAYAPVREAHARCMVALTPSAPEGWYASGVKPTPDDLRRRIAAHPLLSVVLLTYALTWVVLVPIMFESRGWLPFSVPAIGVIAAAWAPLLGAKAVAISVGGPRALGAHFGRFLIWRIRPFWYSLVLLGRLHSRGRSNRSPDRVV